MTVESGVLLVDDHRIVLEGLALLIDRQDNLHVCGTANDARSALSAVSTTNPRVVIVDIALGHDDGLELIKVIHSQWPEVGILALSMHSESMYAERALRAGASGYLRKDDAPERFLEALQTVLDGGVHISPEIKERVFSRAMGRAVEDCRMPTESLSDRELTVLRLMGAGRT
ncbi:MAG: response regulator transcription factor, partial [Phycisphaerae bacterium]